MGNREFYNHWPQVYRGNVAAFSPVRHENWRRGLNNQFYHIRLQDTAKISGLDGHLIEKSSKYQWFTRPVLGTERLCGLNLHRIYTD